MLNTKALEPYRFKPVEFFEDRLGIKPHEGQARFLREAFRFDERGHLVYKYPNLTASNRWGKTVIVAGVHLWFAVFKHGLYKSGASWLHHRYGIINLCPLVDLANVTRDMVNDILMNRAKEQINNPDGRGYCDIGPLFEKSDYGFLVNFSKDYKGFRMILTNVSLEYRTTDDNAKAVQGTPKFLITFDEAGRQKNFLNLIGAHVNPRTLDTGGVIFTATTPDVDTGNDYEEWWEKGNPENEFRDPHFFSMNGAISDNPYVTKKMIEDLLAGTPEYLKDQVLLGKFVQGADAFFSKPSIDRNWKDDIKPSEARQNKHQYVIAADLAVAQAGDRSVFAVWDITTKPYRVMRIIEKSRGTPAPVLINDLKELLEYYNAEWVNPLSGLTESCTAELVYDSTGMGGKMFRDELSTLDPYPRGFDFGGVTKKKLEILATLRLVLDKDMLVVPGVYLNAKQEFRNYKRTDAKLETDTVMAMALAAYLAERSVVADDAQKFAGVY